MRFNSIDHVYKCKPPILGNDKAEDPFFISVKGIPGKEVDQSIVEQSMLTPDNRLKKTLEQIGKQVISIENLTVGDKEIKTFDDIYNHAPREIYEWVCRVVHSTQALTDAEVKN